MISLQGVTKSFGRKIAVNGLSLDVAAGEFFALLGPNGAGKTTTIKLMAGLLRPTAGRILIGGLDVQERAIEAKRLMGYVPDQPFLYDRLSGLEFLNFVADLYGVDGAERRREMDRLVDLFSMGEYIHELVESYSHGMRQRVVLAATLLHRPKVILVDEPLVGLDPHTARLVKEIFHREARSGTSIFMSTHILSVAEDLADRIGIMREGRIVALGGMEDLRCQAGAAGRLEDIFFRITGEPGAAGEPPEQPHG